MDCVYQLVLTKDSRDYGEVGENCFWIQGTAVKLQEQPFRILALLLEAQGEVLSREDIRKNIWPEGTFVEFDGSADGAARRTKRQRRKSCLH